MRKTTFSVLSLAALGLTAQAQQRPNVIFVLADDLGYGDLSCYEGEAPTPHIDQLAREGVRFTNAHAVASTSTPSRYGMLTGCYPFRRPGTDVAAGNAGMIIKPEQYTVADAFHNAGYRTAAIGKWHLGLGSKTAQQDWNGELDQTPRDLGFDYHYIMAATADRVPCVFIEQGRVKNWDPEAPIEVSYDWGKPFPGEPLGRTHPELLTKQRHSHGHDMAIVNGIGRIGYMRGGGKALWRDEDIPDSLLHYAIKWIGEQTMERGEQAAPFFMYFATNDVHVPRQPHERFRGKSPMGLRGEAILQFDYTIGQLRAALDSLGIADNTLIIITSDNGPVLDDGYADRAEELVGTHKPGGPYRGGKYSAYEAGNVVPFIVSGAGAKRGKVSNALVSLIDLPATMAAMVGVDIPAGQATDSRECLKTWLGRSKKPAPYHVSMAANRSLEVRDQRWKYIEPSRGSIGWGPNIESGYSQEPQLYDMSRAAWEQDNQAERQPKVLQRMQQLLQSIRK
ncbi:MAG: sulfatase-like hydrolase/transferase [Bacteroidaceae bacterium]|nr:sulfatase-like hydrolase/transferase [Bacteroidaceae bacterium]